MNISLEFPSPLGGYRVETIDVPDVEALRSLLKAKKVVGCFRYSRCIATNDGTCDGPETGVDALTQQDLEWASAKVPVRSRYLLCVVPLK
jgi:hypothetical protein